MKLKIRNPGIQKGVLTAQARCTEAFQINISQCFVRWMRVALVYFSGLELKLTSLCRRSYVHAFC